MLHHSFQCLLYCHQKEPTSSGFLVAALGSTLFVFGTGEWNSGKVLSQCALGVQSQSQDDGVKTDAPTAQSATDEVEPKDTNGEPPAKRLKTEVSSIASESSSTEIVVENDLEIQNSFANAIIKLAATSDGRHVIAVTGEDKRIRVLELSASGILRQWSDR